MASASQSVRAPTAMAPFGQIDSSLARRYEGTGLGLPLTKAFVELHGGQLAIASELDKGTSVTVVLPGASRAQLRSEFREYDAAD